MPSQLVKVDDMALRIKKASPDHGIEGLALLGGRPLIQAGTLELLAQLTDSV